MPATLAGRFFHQYVLLQPQEDGFILWLPALWLWIMCFVDNDIEIVQSRRRVMEPITIGYMT